MCIRDRLLPAAATQELIFKRVSAYNLSYGDFINSDSLKKTGGIKSVSYTHLDVYKRQS